MAAVADPTSRPLASTLVLQARGLACERGSRRLFEGLDLDVAAGEIVWLRGANGRGKTSLLRLLCGLSSPAAGDIRTPLSRPGAAHGDSPAAQAPCWIAHANALKDDLGAGEALRFLCALAGRPASADEARQALSRMGVGSRLDAPVRTLSQGQRRRVALARLALALPVTLWLLDEPFDALDGDGVQALKTLLQDHAQLGGATVLTSHQDADLPSLARGGHARLREVWLDQWAPAGGQGSRP